MKISSLSLPYPVLGVRDDISGKYDIAGLEITTRRDTTEIKLEHVLVNHEIYEMVQEQKAEYVTQVHCMKTVFRQCFPSTSKCQEIKIESDDLRDRVELEFFVVAAKEITDYQPSSAHPDYAGFQFRLTRGDVLAHGGTTNFVAQKQYMGSEAVGSFMMVEEGTWKVGPMKYELNRSKITIFLSQEDYLRYKQLHVSRSFDRIFHSSLVLPALIYALLQMADGRDVFEDLRWFQVLEDRKANDLTLVGESWDRSNAPVIAQLLLGNPMDRTLSNLLDLVGQTGLGVD